jgi:endonuclease-3
MQKNKIKQILKFLAKRYKIKRWKEDPFKVLIITILSQRTKDEVTREASKRLLKVAKTPEEILKLSEERIAKLIYPVGFYREKAKKIRKLCKILIEKYGGEVPSSREELLKLPGVGDKTASCVLCFGFGVPTIPVDIHASVIANRLGLTKSKNPEDIRKDLEKLIPEKLRYIVNLGFVEFGKEICSTRNPKCSICPLKNLCEYFKRIKYPK